MYSRRRLDEGHTSYKEMDLRNLPEGLSPEDRCEARRTFMEEELGCDLSALSVDPAKLGAAEEKNCEQMFGHVPVPVGLAGPLRVQFNSGDEREIFLPLATTEGALVASVNRGCKALTQSDGVRTSSTRIGITRSICFRIPNAESRIPTQEKIESTSKQWTKIGAETSDHLRLTSFDIDTSEDYLFLTLYGDTDEAMGMNMITIAAQAVADWIVQEFEEIQMITIAGNVDSDKKPSARTHDRGRGYTVTAEATLSPTVIKEVLKTTPEALLAVADGKLNHGSRVAGSIGANLHAANVVAALYLATGQDAAHVVEGSLADTHVSVVAETSRRDVFSTVRISVRCPALLVGIRGGGTTLPAQKQCLDLFLGRNMKNEIRRTTLHPCSQLAESIAAAILAGEVSLLAAQASQSLASSHKKLAR